MPKPGWIAAGRLHTWDELHKWAAKIHRPQQGTYGFGLVAGEPFGPWQKFLPLLWQHGGSVVSPDWQECLLASPDALAAMKKHYSLKAVSLVDRQSQRDQAV